MRARGARPIPICFHKSDESKRAEKMLGLVIHGNKSKIVANTLELVLSRTIQTWMKIKSMQDHNGQEDYSGYEQKRRCSPRFMINK
jgi:hypothetical protein